jgi:hypothetical protein
MGGIAIVVKIKWKTQPLLLDCSESETGLRVVLRPNICCMFRICDLEWNRFGLIRLSAFLIVS